MSKRRKEQTNKTVLGSQAVHILMSKVKDGTISEIVSDWKWIFSFSRKFRGTIALYTMLGILSGILGIASGVTGKYLIDVITSYDPKRLPAMAAVLALSIILSLTFKSAASRLSARLSVNMNNEMQTCVLDSILSSRWSEINRYSSGDLLNRFSNDIQVASSGAVSWLPNVITNIIVVAAAFCVILYYDPIMALITLLSTPVLLIMSRYFIKRQRQYNQRVRELSSELSAFEVETFRNTDTIKSFGLEKHFGYELYRHQQAYKAAALDYNLFGIKTNVYLSVLSAVVQYAVFAYCLWRLWRGEILFSTMFLFLQQRSTLAGAFSGLVSLVPTALTGSVSAHRVIELTQMEKEQRYGGISDSLRESCHVVLENVSASYSSGRTVLENMSFTAGPGELVALVGPSGDGKTTMLRLLLGLILPESGRAAVKDGMGREYGIGADTRGCFSYVPQGSSLMSGTIAENLRLVSPSASDEELISVLKAACAWSFVEKLPDGINSRIMEGGKGLSEGQAQRIAVARALLRRAPVLLLDEATSAIDIVSERALLRNIAGLGRTCIITTHRPTVLSMCSRVYGIRNRRFEVLTEEEIERLINDF